MYIEQPQFEAEDIEKNKIMATLAYILFFLPLIACPESRYARFHANQGLLLLIVGVGINIITFIIRLIPFFGWMIGTVISAICGIGILLIIIFWMIDAYKGVAKPLPILGGVHLLDR